ncbi:hypothetical protein BM221_000371 [Beauveria bassiana]|uniref:Uncharacterized protein n=1 Tax=Beauveria bassiana TaxID=176275 RepID=A0A2N6P0B4_BEABA|nr:hypothetical protein BM221_000371 [Beauveria bassiana]
MSFVNICQQTSVTRTKESPVPFLWRNVTAQKRRQTAAAAFSFDAEVLAGRSGLVPVSTFAFFPTCRASWQGGQAARRAHVAHHPLVPE